MSPDGPGHDGGSTGETAPALRNEPFVMGDRLIGRTIGRYSIKRVIASGGMGVVYEALQESPRRVVALKVMKAGIASRSALKRFEYESQILGRLRHPGIAQIYEAGVARVSGGTALGGTALQSGDWAAGDTALKGSATAEELPFFAMEYIPAARTIVEYAREKKLGTRERLELFAKVCDAVHHGHQKGIIHRDLKPSNVLVDSAGQPKIIDFGVARATDSDMALTTLQTDVGQLIGTLQYMSPEQCQADPHDIDTRSDVYALGVVLYELLCERLPYDVSKVAVFEAARVIREQSPARPSTIAKSLRGDVETIALKALEKERDRRYRSAADLGDDLRRYLNNEPISATPPSLMYQVRSFARRNKTVFRASVALLVVLVLGVIGTTIGLLRAEVQRQWAVSATKQAQTATKQAELAALRERDAAAQATAAAASEREAKEEALVARALADEKSREAEAREKEARFEAYIANIAAADAALRVNEIATVRRRLDACPEDLRHWEWRYLDAESDNSITVLRGHEGWVTAATVSPDGARVATTSMDRTARLWDAATGREMASCTGTRRGSGPRPSAPTVPAWSQRRTTRPRACGTWPAARNWQSYEATKEWYPQPPSAPTAHACSPRRGTGQRDSGTGRRG